MREENNKDIKWAVLGTGVIANEMAQALQKSGKKLFAVGNRTYSKAVAFAEKYGVEKVYSDFNDMFTDLIISVGYLFKVKSVFSIYFNINILGSHLYISNVLSSPFFINLIPLHE